MEIHLRQNYFTSFLIFTNSHRALSPNQQSTRSALTYRWTFLSELSLQLYHRVSEGLNPMGRTIHRRRRRRRHQTNRRAASNCTNWKFLISQTVLKLLLCQVSYQQPVGGWGVGKCEYCQNPTLLFSLASVLS